MAGNYAFIAVKQSLQNRGNLRNVRSTNLCTVLPHKQWEPTRNVSKTYWSASHRSPGKNIFSPRESTVYGTRWFVYGKPVHRFKVEAAVDFSVLGKNYRGSFERRIVRERWRTESLFANIGMHRWNRRNETNKRTAEQPTAWYNIFNDRPRRETIDRRLATIDYRPGKKICRTVYQRIGHTSGYRANRWNKFLRNGHLFASCFR